MATHPASCEKPRDSVSSRHLEEPEIRSGLSTLKKLAVETTEMLAPFVDKYGEEDSREPRKLRNAIFSATRAGEFGLLRDLHDLYLVMSEAHVSATILFQASQALRDGELLQTCQQIEDKHRIQRELLLTQIKHRAPHALVVPF